MLKNPKINKKPIVEGVFEIDGFNFEYMFKMPKLEYPLDYEYKYPQFEKIYSDGVCDTIEQFIAKIVPVLEADERTFCASLTHIEKDPSNAYKGGGWRWHKWGPYIGDHEHHEEYLDDEEGFENGVYVYRIIQLEGPIKYLNFKTGLLQNEPYRIGKNIVPI